ncbi:hypothetical protein [Psychromonas aquimarina]|uniref:hypothetical protein n=1 Tax=Psychromonas aquimarina TaxID=444919 RepID=UPI00041B88BB|nr:hypothetical protein [Psychromonas aquimarina]
MNLFNIAKITLLASTFVFSASSFAERTPEQIFKEVSKRADKARTLPKAQSVVLFGNDNEAVVILDNPRWVVKGQLFDMFQNKPIANTKELLIAEKTIPLNQLKIDTVNVLSFTLNSQKSKELIIFIDPFLADSANTVNVIETASKHYRVRFILTPFTQTSVEQLFKFSCLVKRESAKQILQRIKYKKFGTGETFCDQDLVSKSYGLAGFLKLTNSPTLIASNDIASDGMPVSIVAFLAKNME